MAEGGGRMIGLGRIAADMNRVTTLLKGSLVTVFRFDHPCGVRHFDPPHEVGEKFAVCFVEQGEFALGLGKRQWQMTRGATFVTHPHVEYHYAHAERRPSDSCLVLEFEDPTTGGTDKRWRLGRKYLETILPPANRLAYLQLRLKRFLAVAEAPPADLPALAADELGGEFLLAAISDGADYNRRLSRPHQVAWYADRIDATRSLLEHDYASEHSLRALGNLVGMSPWHFAHVFREFTGVPPHRYLLEARLRQARRRLQGRSSVTAACYESGFSNLSHFIRLFRRRFGVLPSRLWSSKE
jgi:AraC family transcriptional regulator